MLQSAAIQGNGADDDDYAVRRLSNTRNAHPMTTQEARHHVDTPVLLRPAALDSQIEQEAIPHSQLQQRTTRQTAASSQQDKRIY